MKSKNIGMYMLYSLIGFIIMAGGAILGKNFREAEGILQALPYILIGIGAGILGQNLGTVFNIIAAKKDPQLAKRKEIEEKDERNIIIRNKAKAKAYDLMIMVFGTLMLALGMLEANWTIIIALVVSYLFVAAANVYYLNKFNKEM